MSRRYHLANSSRRLARAGFGKSRYGLTSQMFFERHPDDFDAAYFLNGFGCKSGLITEGSESKVHPVVYLRREVDNAFKLFDTPEVLFGDALTWARNVLIFEDSFHSQVDFDINHNVTLISNSGPTGSNAALEIQVNGVTSTHSFARNSTFNIGFEATVTFQVWIPSTNSIVDGLLVRDSGSGGLIQNFDFLPKDQWIEISTTGTPVASSRLDIYLKNGSDLSFQDLGADDRVYIRNLNVTQSKTRCFAQKWYDGTGNGYHAEQPAEESQPLLIDLDGIIKDSFGRIGLYFDGVDDYMICPAALAGIYSGVNQPISVMGVAQHENEATTNIFGLGNSASSDSTQLFRFTTTNHSYYSKDDAVASKSAGSGDSDNAGVFTFINIAEINSWDDGKVCIPGTNTSLGQRTHNTATIGGVSRLGGISSYYKGVLNCLFLSSGDLTARRAVFEDEINSIINFSLSEEIDVWLALGQSNQAGTTGAESVTIADASNDDKILNWELSGGWDFTTNGPTAGYNSTNKWELLRSKPSFGPSVAFIRRRYADAYASSSMKLGVFKFAFGGRGIEDAWYDGAARDYPLIDQLETYWASAKADLESRGFIVNLKGVCGCFCEDDTDNVTDQAEADSWEANVLQSFISDLRSRFEVPVMAWMRITNYAAPEPYTAGWPLIRAALASTFNADENAYLIDADTADDGDQLHLSSLGREQVGVEMAKAVNGDPYNQAT